MKPAICWGFAAAFALCLPLAAQRHQTEIPTTFGETIDVRVVNVEAVVAKLPKSKRPA